MFQLFVAFLHETCLRTTLRNEAWRPDARVTHFHPVLVPGSVTRPCRRCSVPTPAELFGFFEVENHIISKLLPFLPSFLMFIILICVFLSVGPPGTFSPMLRQGPGHSEVRAKTAVCVAGWIFTAVPQTISNCVLNDPCRPGDARHMFLISMPCTVWWEPRKPINTQTHK